MGVYSSLKDFWKLWECGESAVFLPHEQFIVDFSWPVRRVRCIRQEDVPNVWLKLEAANEGYGCGVTTTGPCSV